MYRYYQNYGNGKFYNTENYSDDAHSIVRVKYDWSMYLLFNRELDNQYPKNGSETNNFLFVKPIHPKSYKPC